MSAQMANQDNQGELHVIIGTGAVGKHSAHALAALGKRVRFIVDSSKFERTFGLHATPMPQAVAESVAWFKAHPQGAH